MPLLFPRTYLPGRRPAALRLRIGLTHISSGLRLPIKCVAVAVVHVISRIQPDQARPTSRSRRSGSRSLRRTLLLRSRSRRNRCTRGRRCSHRRRRLRSWSRQASPQSFAVEATGAPAAGIAAYHVCTPLCPRHAPLFAAAVEYVPSFQIPFAPAGAPAGACAITLAAPIANPPTTVQSTFVIAATSK